MRGRLMLMICGLLATFSLGCASKRGEADLEQLAPTGARDPGTSISDWSPPPPVQPGQHAAPPSDGAYDTYRQSDVLQQADARAPGLYPPAALPPPDAQSMHQMLVEMQSLGPLEPADHARLMQTLRGTLPEQWPQVLQEFRETQAVRTPQTESAVTAGPQGLPTAATPGRDPALATDQAPLPASTPISNNAPANDSPTTPAEVPAVMAVATDEVSTAEPVKPTPLTSKAAEPKTEQPALLDAAGDTAATPATDAATPSATLAAAPATADSTAVETAVAPAPVAGDVVQASHETPAAPAAPDTALAAAITALESVVVEAPQSPEEFRRHLQLRMLYLAAGRRNDALRPLTGLTAAQQEYWSEQLYGLSVLLDEAKITDPARRAAESREHLNQALVALGQEASLVVHRLNFCTEVNSYGVFTRMENQEFAPGQQLLLYAEVENFHAEPSREGFHTALKSNYQIFDSAGKRLAEHEFPITEEHCQNRRRDYFIRYFLSLPDRCYPGQHTLQLTIEDTLGKKIGQATIEFEVKEPSSQDRKLTTTNQRLD